MKTFARPLLAAIALLACAEAPAMEPSQCIRLNNARLENHCNAKLVVHYCIEGRDTIFSCLRNGNWQAQGSKTLAPGKSEGIPEYRGNGRVYWAACKYPDIPSGWDGPNDRFQCR